MTCSHWVRVKKLQEAGNWRQWIRQSFWGISQWRGKEKWDGSWRKCRKGFFVGLLKWEKLEHVCIIKELWGSLQTTSFFFFPEQGEYHCWCVSKTFYFIFFYFFLIYFIFKLYITVLVLPNIKMNPPQVNILK